eukprot:5454424-Pleurochrysis_carterae.AAC.1
MRTASAVQRLEPFLVVVLRLGAASAPLFNLCAYALSVATGNTLISVAPTPPFHPCKVGATARSTSTSQSLMTGHASHSSEGNKAVRNVPVGSGPHDPVLPATHRLYMPSPATLPQLPGARLSRQARRRRRRSARYTAKKATDRHA